MNITDLMIGDWINVFGIPKQIEGIRTFKNGDEIVYYDGDNGNFIKYVTPIPLTKEIFEKNRFGYEQGHSSEVYWLEEHDTFHVYRYYQNHDYHVILGDTYDDENVDKKISYVHELQHALKLCGIEKEIVL